MFVKNLQNSIELLLQISLVINSVFCETEKKSLSKRINYDEVLIKTSEIFKPNTDSDYWISVDSYGLMLSHHPVKSNYVNGIPVVTRDGGEDDLEKDKEDQSSVFSPSLASLTSSFEDFINVDDNLLHDLSESSWIGNRINPVNGRDLVTRESGEIVLSKRSDGSQTINIDLANKAVGGKRRRTQSSSLSVDEKNSAKRLVLKRKTSSAVTQKRAIKSTVSKTSEKIKTVVKSATISTKITWYTGSDLLNPYCVRESKWTPTDSSLVIAVTQQWKGRPNCGDFFEIKVTGKKQRFQVGTSVIARVVDLCGGCKPEVPHADLSKAAFLKLFDLEVGIVSGLSMKKVGAPKDWDENLYGPKIL